MHPLLGDGQQPVLMDARGTLPTPVGTTPEGHPTKGYVGAVKTKVPSVERPLFGQRRGLVDCGNERQVGSQRAPFPRRSARRSTAARLWASLMWM